MVREPVVRSLRERSFASAVLSPHLNLHRPCLFATPVADGNGRVRKTHRDDDVATPYERLKSIEGSERLLKPGLSFTALDAEASVMSDLESARLVNRERDKLFRAVGSAWPSEDLLSESANGIIAHHLNQFPTRPQARNIALRSGSFRYWN